MERKKGLGEWSRDGNSKAEDTWTIRRRKRGERKEVNEKMPKLDNVGGHVCCPGAGWEVS